MQVYFEKVFPSQLSALTATFLMRNLKLHMEICCSEHSYTIVDVRLLESAVRHRAVIGQHWLLGCSIKEVVQPTAAAFHKANQTAQNCGEYC